MESLSISSVPETHSLLNHRTPSSAAGTPRPAFLKFTQPSQHSFVAPLRLSALPSQLPSEEGDEPNASGLASQSQVILVLFSPSLSINHACLVKFRYRTSKIRLQKK